LVACEAESNAVKNQLAVIIFIFNKNEISSNHIYIKKRKPKITI